MRILETAILLFIVAVLIGVSSISRAQSQLPKHVITPEIANVAQDVYASDLNGDGDQDVLSASSRDDKIAWYENVDGEGSFSDQKVITTSADGARSVYAADIDGDGDQDVLSASRGDDKIAWYENVDGEGSFSDQKIITTSADRAESVYAADIDGDGDRDVLFAASRDDEIVWHENTDGQGSFSGQKIITTNADYAQSVYTADIDGDNDHDVLSASSGDDKIAWYENTDGEGSFSDQKVITTSADGARSVNAADLDEDGDQDVLSASRSDDKIAWYENTDGEGSFSEQKTITSSARGAVDVHTADLDEDNNTDIIAASQFDKNPVTAYENQIDENGGFGGEIQVDSQSPSAESVYSSDLDGDGDQDPISVSKREDKVAWHDNQIDQGNGFVSIYIVPVDRVDGLYSIDIADVDGNGDQDVLSASSGKIAWYENTDGEGSFSDQKIITTSADNARSVYAADIDGDGDQDVLSASRGDDKIAWYENVDGEGSFSDQKIITTSADGAESVYAADIDGDGDQDVLFAASRDDKVAWHENTDGEGSFSDQKIITTSADGARSVYAADIDGDGDQDVIYGAEFDREVGWYENTDGKGSFSSSNIIHSSAGQVQSVYVSDVDDDNDNDVLSASFDGLVWHVNTGGTEAFSDSEVISTESTPSVYADDLDGDGDEDILSGRTVWFEQSTSFGKISFSGPSKIGTALSRDIISGDLTGDGVPDILGGGTRRTSQVAYYENTLTLDTTPPSVPSGLAATAEGSEMSLNWTANTDVDLAEYRIYRDTAPIDSAAGPESLTPLNSVEADTSRYADTSAVPGTEYHYRVTAVDTAANESGFSEEATAVPNDVMPPSVPRGLTATVEDSLVNLEWTANTESDLAGYRLYRGDGEVPDTSYAPLSEELLSETTYTDSSITENRTYRYGVTAVDTAGNESALSEVASVFRYPSQIQAKVNRSFGEADGPGDYRLVALPGETSRPIGDVISGEAGSEWQAYRDNGSGDDFLQKYDGSGSFTFEPGNGFWVTATSTLAFEDSVSTVSLQGDSAAKITLRQGWNVISNPIDKSVEWSRVEQANGGSLQPIWSFQGAFSQADSLGSAVSGRAYYMFNGSADRTELLIPYPGSPSSPISKTESRASSTTGQEANLLSLSVTPVGSSGPTSTIQVGVQSETSRSVVAPPSRFEAVSLRIKAGEEERQKSRSGLLMVERRKGDGDGETFRLRLKSQETMPVSLTASGLGETEGQSVALLLPSAGKTYRLRADGTVQIGEGQEETALKLAVGTEGYVDEQADQVIPDEVTLTSYPNPFQKQATVEYTLTEQTDVRIALYDVLGRRVATLEEGSKQAGRHQIQLEGTGLSSGVYFGRLEAGGQTLTQKITVVR